MHSYNNISSQILIATEKKNQEIIFHNYYFYIYTFDITVM